MTLMKYYECLRMKTKDTPQEIIEEHNLHSLAHDDWVCVEIRRGAHGLPQAGVLVHAQLTTHLNAEGCPKATTTPGL